MILWIIFSPPGTKSTSSALRWAVTRQATLADFATNFLTGGLSFFLAEELTKEKEQNVISPPASFWTMQKFDTGINLLWTLLRVTGLDPSGPLFHSVTREDRLDPWAFFLLLSFLKEIQESESAQITLLACSATTFVWLWYPFVYFCLDRNMAQDRRSICGCDPHSWKVDWRRGCLGLLL